MLLDHHHHHRSPPSQQQQGKKTGGGKSGSKERLNQSSDDSGGFAIDEQGERKRWSLVVTRGHTWTHTWPTNKIKKCSHALMWGETLVKLRI